MAAFIGEITVLFVTIQCFIILKCLKKLRPDIKKTGCYRILSKFIHCGPVIAFIIFSIIFYFLKLIELNFSKNTSKFIVFIHSTFAVYIWINVLFNYLAAMVTKPGKPPHQHDLRNNNMNLSKLDFCKTCNRLRCYGTHHCLQCNICIRMFCHHSSFVNNCIGLSNFAYYFSFLAYSVIGLFYLFILTYGPFYSCYLHNHRLSDVSLKYPALDIFVCSKVGELPLVFFGVLAALIIIGSLFLIHVILLAADLSYSSFVRHAKESKNILRFLKNLIKKCCAKHRRVKLKNLLLERKRLWVYFFIPTLNELAEGLTMDDLNESDEDYVQMI